MLFLKSQNGMGGLAHLPEAGGLLDQPAGLMDAFDVLRATFRQLEKEDG